MATDRADARDTSQSATQLQRIDGFASRHFAVLIAAVGLLCAALMFHATRGGVFHNDDVQLIGQAQDHGFSVRGLFGEPQFLEHLVPVSNILSWFVAVTGAHWWVAHWYSALGTALLTVLMGYLLRRIAQSSAVALVVAAAVGSSMVIATIALWWAATTLQLGMLCAGAAMLILSLRWIDSRSRWALTGALFFQLLACGFYDRAQLLPLLAWALVAVARPSGPALTGRSFVDQSRAAAPLLVGLLAIVIAQFVLTLVFGVQNSEGLEAAAHTSLATWVEVVADWWVVGAGSVVSNGFSGVGLSAAEALLRPRSASGVMFLALLAAVTIRNRRAALTWTALVVLVTLSGIQIASGRLVLMTPLRLAASHRYQELTLFFIAVLVPAAWAASGRPWPASRRVGQVLLALTVLAGGFWLVNLRLVVQSQVPWMNRAAPYAERFASSLSAWSASGRPVTLLDERVPGYVVIRVPQTGSYDLTSKIARIYANGVKVPPLNRVGGPAIRIDGSGVFREIRFGKEIPVPLTGPRCEASSETADWLKPGVVRFSGEIPASIREAGRAIAVSVRLRRSNGRGTLGIVVPGEPLPLFTAPVSQYPAGLRTIVPAGTAEVALELWKGAAACRSGMSVAPIIAP